MNILEKTLNKVLDKMINGFVCINKLAKTRLWLASFLAALYAISIGVGSIVGLLLVVVSMILSLLGTCWVIANIVYIVGLLCHTIGNGMFYTLLLCVIIFIITLFMKKIFKSEIEKGD